MAINATSNSQPRELIPAGNYIARCYSMIHVGTVHEIYMGQPKVMNRVRIGWELPTEQRIFDKAKGNQPLVISKELTVSMHEKATLRKMLASWRGKDFSDDEAKCFDITKLVGVPCLLNIIHKQKQDKSGIYEDIAGVTPMPKGTVCPPQINANLIWDYDNPNYDVFNAMPDFIKQKIQGSEEYKKLHTPNNVEMNNNDYAGVNSMPEPITADSFDDLPF